MRLLMPSITCSPLPPCRANVAHPVRQLVIVGHDAAGVAISAEIFSGIKRERRGVAKRADEFSLEPRQMRLRAIFNHPQLVFFGDGHDRVHVRRLAVKMHRNNSHRARSDFRFDLRGIDVERVVVRVAENHPAAGLRDGFRRRNPRVRGR